VDLFKVVPISYQQAMEWCLKKHYARRKPMYQFAYGLVENNFIVGVVVYGRPPVQIEKNIFKNKIDGVTIYELTRLVIQTKTKNAASFLISNSLKLLPKPSAIVSYADSGMNHCGIVYQATNWIYTGGNKAHDSEYIVNGKKMHPKTITERFGITAISKWAKENNIETIPPKIKYRYFFLNADKRTKRKMLNELTYKIINEYPKCEKHNYDDGDDIYMKLVKNETQTSLF
jgi:hypothetical protein